MTIAFVVIWTRSWPPVLGAEDPSTWQEDAALHDVQFVDTQTGYAVGAHGSILKTADGGRSWRILTSGTSGSLQSICFLTDQIGWVAGRDVIPFAGIDSGVLFFTDNGGETWNPISSCELPALHFVKFFGLEEGIVVGHPSASAPSGILKTTDGGQSWQPIAGSVSHPWRAAAFLDLERGAVGGSEARLSLVSGEQLLASKLPSQGLRSIRALTLQHATNDDQGWLAGDGGLVLHTTSGGVVWEPPLAALPEALRQGMDFHAVEMRQDNVWIAGSPGSVIVHSSNGGRSWNTQSTGQSTPLHSIRFANATHGAAVGALGVILRTQDGGQSWQIVRGSGRRSAILSIQSRPSRVSTAWIAKLSGEDGYRSSVWIANRQDFGETAQSGDLNSRLSTAIERCGGNSAEIHWQLPVAVTGLEYDSGKLLADWQKRTEGKLGLTLVGTLVRQLRMWKPTVVMLDQPAADDAASQLLLDAALRAIEDAADATRFLEQSEGMGLRPWKVERIYMKLRNGAGGDAVVELDEYLPTRKTTVRMAASASDSLLRTDGTDSGRDSGVPRLAFRWIGSDGRPALAKKLARDFFADLPIEPGSAARRKISFRDDRDLERRQKLAQKQRNFSVMTHQSIDDPRLAGQMIGQLGGLVDAMDPGQGAELMRGLAAEYLDRSLYELAEATNVELVRRYPNEPVSLEAMRWLIQFWSSQETAWQRTRMMSNTTVQPVVDQASNARQLQQVANTLTHGTGSVTTAELQKEGPTFGQFQNPGHLNRLNVKLDFDNQGVADGKKKRAQTTRLSSVNPQDWRADSVRDWHKRATNLANQLQTQSTSLSMSPEIQFPLAALRRGGHAGSAQQAEPIYRTFLTRATDDAIRSLAQRELWAMFATAEDPQELLTCRKSGEKPILDGTLSDVCWQNAKEIMLTRQTRDDEISAESEATDSLVMLAYDDEFLYVGLSMPRLESGAIDPSVKKNRSHDADLSRQDHLTLCLDIDRDYTTWYEFQVDLRGLTFESCWGDRRWDPAWYVATDIEDSHWRVEAAIPWSELTPTPPREGSVWSIAVTRTTPTVGMRAWVQPPLKRPRPSSFGLLRFQ